MKKIDVFVFIDALGWEVLKKHKFLEDILPYRYPVKMQFGYSSTAIPTILSGEPPAVHKHLSFYYYHPEQSPFKVFKYLKMDWLPTAIFNRWRVRHIISKILAKIHGFTGYFEIYAMPYGRMPFFDYSEKTDMFVAGGLYPVKNIADVLEENHTPYHISDWRRTEQENVDALLADLEKGNIRFALLYNAALDSLLHFNGKNSRAAADKIAWYRTQIGIIYEKCRECYDEFTLNIMSDHGMTDKIGTVDVKGTVEALNLKFGKDYAAVYDSTMARFWYLSQGSREKIIAAVEKLPHCRILTEKDKIKFGINFRNNMYGETFLLMDPGLQIEPSDMGKSLPAMHGYTPEDVDSTASFLTNDQHITPPEWVGDYFRVMAAKITKTAQAHQEYQEKI